MPGEKSAKIGGVPYRTAGRLHGDHLIAEVLRNMEEGLFRIRGKTVVPSVYRIYLNPEDYDPLRDVALFIVQEIRATLDEQLTSWNGARVRLPPKLLGRLSAGDSNKGQYVRLGDKWTVEIQPDLDGKLDPGEIEIYSELGAPQKPEYSGGSMTRRIFPIAAVPPPVEVPVKAELPAKKEPPPEKESPPQKDPIHAYLRFADEHGPHVFEVTRNQVVIGRGGRSYWVDLKLDTLPDVSREHCRLRRNPETGRFTIEDVSQFGTSVDGKPVGQNTVAPLPPRATISLAGVIELQWEVA
jgi:hypothetical protein